MPDYRKGKIYKIVCDTTGETYYGSTIQSLSVRLSGHKKNKDCSCSQIIERGNYCIVLVEDYPCENKEHLNKRERYYIENNECINKVIPTRTMQEWSADNKDRLKLNHKKWRDNNKEKLIENQREYRAKKKEEKLKSLSSNQ